LDAPVVAQLFLRMVFNVVARNQDDHVKNISFLMDRDGAWSLAPAYDLTWAWQPGNPWLDSHQMTINRKRDGFTLTDLREVARVAGLRHPRAETILAQVVEAVAGWSAIAAEVGLDEQMATQIANSHRLMLPPG